MEDPITEIEQRLQDIDDDMTRIFEQKRKLDAAMEHRKQQEQQLSHDRFSTPQPHQVGSGHNSHTSPLTIRSKLKLKRTRDKAAEALDYEREGTPSKRVNITESSVQEEREPSLESLGALEATLSRNDKAQGISTGNIIHGKRRRG